MFTVNKFCFICFKDSLLGKQDNLTLNIEANENSMFCLLLNIHFISFWLNRIIFEKLRLGCIIVFVKNAACLLEPVSLT